MEGEGRGWERGVCSSLLCHQERASGARQYLMTPYLLSIVFLGLSLVCAVFPPPSPPLPQSHPLSPYRGWSCRHCRHRKQRGRREQSGCSNRRMQRMGKALDLHPKQSSNLMCQPTTKEALHQVLEITS